MYCNSVCAHNYRYRQKARRDAIAKGAPWPCKRCGKAKVCKANASYCSEECRKEANRVDTLARHHARKARSKKHRTQRIFERTNMDNKTELIDELKRKVKDMEAELEAAQELAADYERITIPVLIERAYKTAKSKGWHDQPVDLAVRLCLVHSEISEALEFYRDGWNPQALMHEYDGAKPDGVPAELADAVIRIFDLCGAEGIDLSAAITAKMAYNETREYRHGGKVV